MSYAEYSRYAERSHIPPMTDEGINAAFEDTNFGRTDYRNILEAGLLKVACGWHNGGTLTGIMMQLGLITKKRNKLTKKGKLVLWIAYKKEE